LRKVFILVQFFVRVCFSIYIHGSVKRGHSSEVCLSMWLVNEG